MPHPRTYVGKGKLEEIRTYIKENNIDATTLDWLKEKVGSYEALFSKRAIKIPIMRAFRRTNLKSEFS